MQPKNLLMRARWVTPARWGMFGAAALLLTAGCAGTTSATVAYDYPGTYVYDYPATYVETIPVDIVYHPRAYYRGHYAYWVDDRWYYPSSRGWVVFREEPHELQRYRVYNPHGFEAAPRRYRATPEYGIPDRRYYGTPHVVPQQRRYHAPPVVPQPAQPRYHAPQVAPPQPQPRYHAPQVAPTPSPPSQPRYHAPPSQAPSQVQRYYRPR